MKYLIISILSVFVFSSCVTHGELLNFNQGEPLSERPVPINNLPELKIQPDDLLSIQVKALEAEAVVPFNLDPPNTNNVNTGGNSRPLIGYLVTKEGTIDFPILGTLNVLGITTTELRLLLEQKLETYLKSPIVMVRFLNFRITILGEVTSPGTFFVSSERVTILDALGEVGDITSYGNRTNVLIVREQNGQRESARLNLQDNRIFESPYFYLQQNDMVYVEPLKVKTASIRDQTQRLLPWLSAITALTTLVLTLRSL